MGLVTVPLHPAAATAVGLWMPRGERNRVNGLITGAALLGVACTYKVFGWLIAKLDWQRAFLITGFVTAVVGVIWLIVSPRSVKQSERTEISGLGLLIGNQSVWLLTLSYAAIGYFQYLFFYWMHYYFDDVLHLGKDASLYYAGIPPLTMAFCMPIGGWLSDRSARRSLVPMAGMALGALLLGCGVLAKAPFWIVFWFSLALGAVGAAEGAFWSTIVEAGGRFGGTAAAIMNTGGNGGGLLAPVVTPWVSASFGWPIGIALGGIVCFTGAICWIGIRPERK
jgi:MFS family permease